MNSLRTKLRIFLSKLKFKKLPFIYRAGFSTENTILILLPPNPSEFSVSLFSVNSLLRYFKNNRIISANKMYFEILRYLFKNITLVDSTTLRNGDKDLLEHKIDIIWDFHFPPSPFRYLPLHTNATYRITTDIESYPYYNIIVKTKKENTIYDIGNIFLSVFNIPESEFRLEIDKKTRRRMWDFLMYKGHNPENLIVIIDTPYPDDARARILLLKKNITFLSIRERTDTCIDISTLSFNEKIALLSLAHFLITDGGVFVGFAGYLNIPIIYTRDFGIPPIFNALYLDDSKKPVELLKEIDKLLKL